MKSRRSFLGTLLKGSVAVGAVAALAKAEGVAPEKQVNRHDSGGRLTCHKCGERLVYSEKQDALWCVCRDVKTNIEHCIPGVIQRVDEHWMRDNKRVALSVVVDELGIDGMRRLIDADRARQRKRIDDEFGL